MYIEININEIDEANRFLRALWAEIRKTYLKSGWHYGPWREGNKQIIHFGDMGIGDNDGPVSVSISYTKRGSIKGIYFELREKELTQSSELGNVLTKSVQGALQNLDNEVAYHFEVTFESEKGPLSSYRGEYYRITPITDREFNLATKVYAYDSVDAENQFRKVVLPVMDILSFETNLPFWLSSKTLKTGEIADSVDSRYVEDTEWIDGYPYSNEHILISQKCEDFLDIIISKNHSNKDILNLLRAARLFHTARKYEYTLLKRNDNFSLGDATVELIPILYMSAMEVISLIGASPTKNCIECGQQMYKIADRVGNLAEELSENSYFKVLFKQFYANRSKYLHLGVQLTSQSYTGISIPQLNNDAPTGCESQGSIISHLNLREYVGYFLRKVLQLKIEF